MRWPAAPVTASLAVLLAALPSCATVGSSPDPPGGAPATQADASPPVEPDPASVDDGVGEPQEAAPEPARPEGGNTSAAGRCPEHPGQVMLTTLNLVRSDRGLAPLRPERRLEAAALAHALDLYRNDSRGHQGSDGSLPQHRARRENYPWIRIGENVATGIGAPSTIVARWMRSPPHREAVLTEVFREAGIGWVPGEDGRASVWVLLLGRRRAAPQGPPGCVSDASRPDGALVDASAGR